MNICLLLLTLLAAVTSCSAKSSGAPLSACSSLLPRHGENIQPQQDKAPYIVTAENVGANKIKVTISSPDGKQFQGFVLQARSANDKNKYIAGKFTTEANSQGINCNGHEQSTLTHVSPDPKTHVTTEWTGTADEDIIFRATVAKTYDTFWTNIDSEPVKTGEKEPEVEGVDPHSAYDECFVSKGCLGLPKMCLNKSNCDILLYYEGADKGVKFTLRGQLNPDEYMAMGLSDDNKMGDDLVTECLRVGTDGTKLRKSWNEGRSNTLTSEVTEDNNATIKDGITTCEWYEPTEFTFNGRKYNLTDKIYYILLAKGKVENGKLIFHDSKLASDEPVDLLGKDPNNHEKHGSTDVQYSSSEKPASKKKVTDAPNNCSKLNYGLFWFVLLGVFYADRRYIQSLI